jgi:putative heme-binding domain-containing protein
MLRLVPFSVFYLLSFTAIAIAQRGDAPNTKLISAAEQRALFHVPPGFEIQLVAAEPEIQKPMNLAFDAAGRVWVTGSTLYPWPAKRDALDQPIATFEKNWDDNPVAFRAAVTLPTPAEHGIDSVRILSDFDPATGRARKITVFADGLNIPIGVLPLPRPADAKGDSALVFSIPAIWRLMDTDGDGRADKREKLYDGFAFKDTHGMSSSYWLWFDGWVYGTHGFNNASEVRDRSGNVTKITSGNTYRFRPDGSKFEIFVNGQTNPFGLAFDSRGDLYTADSHSKPVYLLIPGGYYEGISREHDGLGFAPSITLDDHGSSAIAGIAHYSAAHFPSEFRGNLFNGNPVTRRINRDRLDWRGSTPIAARQPDFLSCDDAAFRPVQVKLGSDGALWIADFYNPIIGHYEVPLTHPSRDNSHGRIWRVVWRGLDRSSPPPTLPDLTRDSTSALVARLTDSNLVVRSLAAAELMSRRDANTVAPALRSAAARLITGIDPKADETALLPLLILLDRLGQNDDALVRQAFLRPGSDAAVVALRALAAREALPNDAEELFTKLLTAPAPEQAARVAADVFRRHVQPWQPKLIFALMDKVAAADTELIYALRLALKTHALVATTETLQAWAAPNATAAERVADVCVAVPTPAAAQFLLGYLERTKFAGTRAGEFARHAVQQLPPDQLSALSTLFDSMVNATPTQRIALAEGLALVAAKPNRTLPPNADTWMRTTIIEAIGDRDANLALRAINAAKPLNMPEKAEPLRRIALNVRARDNNRLAAIRALAPNSADTEAVLVEVLSNNSPHALRRAAADLLGNVQSNEAAHSALAAAIPSASADLALTLVTSLAKSDGGAAKLLDLAAKGQVRPTLLRHRYVELALEKRPAAIRERAAQLTRALPPEDARLDALIAQRLMAAANYKADAKRGAPLFTTHCATCHRIRDTGGNIGPSLDGIGSRSLQRLVEDILDPSRNVDPAFRLHTVTSNTGETKSGMNYRDKGDRIALADPTTGQDFEIVKQDMSDFKSSPISPMPAAFEAMLSEQEFFDLLEFLRSPAK